MMTAMNKNLLRKLESLAPLPGKLKNQYKRQDVFRCTHETHLHFNSAVSVYHVLKAKACWPEGCIYFQWKCRKLNRGEPCPRKYKHVGRACASCQNFFDVKIIKKPEILLPHREFEQFQKDLKFFEDWLGRHRGREVEFSGIINSIKPRYRLKTTAKKSYVVGAGFMVNFLEGFINTDAFHDFVYVPVSTGLQQKFHFAKGDDLSFTGQFNVSQGLVILEKIRGIEIARRGEPCFWTESRARVAQRSGSLLPYQAAKCYACDKGILLNVTEEDTSRRPVRHRMFCLEGVEDPQWCWYAVQKILMLDACPHEEENS